MYDVYVSAEFEKHFNKKLKICIIGPKSKDSFTFDDFGRCNYLSKKDADAYWDEKSSMHMQMHFCDFL